MTAETRVAPGLYANILERPGSIVSASQVASALYPLTRLYDGRPSQKFIFPALAADDYIQVDINQVLNGTLNSFTGNDPDDWTVEESGTGAVTSQSGVIVSGTGVQLSNGASGAAAIRQDVLCLSGENMLLDLHAATNNADTPYKVEVINVQTGNYLTPAGAWQAAQDNAVESNETSIAHKTLAFTIEPYSTTRSHIVYLRVRLHMDGSTASRITSFDDVFLIPQVNAASVHGHNLDPKLVVTLRSSDDLSVDTPFAYDDDLEATFTVDVPSFYAVLATPRTKRFWRVPKIVGTNSTQTGSIALGEVALLQTRTLIRAPKNRGLEIAEILPQEAQETRVSGEQWRLQHSQFKQRTARLQWNHDTAAASGMAAQFKGEIFERAKFGVDPIFIIIRDDRTSACLHARVTARASYRVEGGFVESTEATLQESAYGVITE